MVAAAAATAVLAALGACSAGDASDASYGQESVEDAFAPDQWRYVPTEPQEEYDDSPEQPFQDVATSPLSTFASDVDTASYSNLRRQLRQGVAPSGVRIEELVNYFDLSAPVVVQTRADGTSTSWGGYSPDRIKEFVDLYRAEHPETAKQTVMSGVVAA